MDKSINVGCEDRLAMDERHIYPRYMGFRLADETLQADWFVNFPETDSDTGPLAFPFIYPEYAQLLTNMAFAYMLTEDEKYLAMKDRLLTMARYQPNGCSSPEGFPNGEKFCTKITEFMGVCFDWLYPILSADERETIIHSLDWRIEHTLSQLPPQEAVVCSCHTQRGDSLH